MKQIKNVVFFIKKNIIKILKIKKNIKKNIKNIVKNGLNLLLVGRDLILNIM